MLRVLDHLGTGSLIYCPLNGVLAADDHFASIVRKPRNEIFGLTMEAVTHEDDRITNRWLLDQALRTGEPFVLRKRYSYGDGTSQWVENRYTVLRSVQGEPLVSMLCRRVDGPRCPGDLREIDVMSYKAYIKNLAMGLSDMARLSSHTLATDLLAVASQVIEIEDP